MLARTITVLLSLGLLLPLTAIAEDAEPTARCDVAPIAQPNPGPSDPRIRGIGTLRDLITEYGGGSRLEPYSRLRVVGLRTGYGTTERATNDAKFIVVTMVLDAGFRWFEPEINIGAAEYVQQSDPVISGLFNVAGVNKNRSFHLTAQMCDARTAASNDALEVYNRLGQELFGARFQPRTAPAPVKMTRAYPPPTRF